MNSLEYLTLARMLAPECLAVLTALTVLMLDLGWFRHGYPRDRAKRSALVCCFGAFLAGVAAIAVPEGGVAGSGALVITGTSQWLKLILLLLSGTVALSAAGEDFTQHVGEFHALVLLATVGMMLLVSNEHLLTTFVALELVSLSLYVLTAFNKRNPHSAEAALKYFLFGGVAAAFLLFGFSLLYGITGTLQFTAMPSTLHAHRQDPLVWVTLAMIAAGLGFKVAAVPFHLWAPDAYEGAPAPAAALVASGSKIAGFVIFARLVHVGLVPVEGSAGWKAFSAGWAPMLALLASASMVLGNLAALTQTHLRRLLAYSAVAHAGYGIVGILGQGTHAVPAVLYFAATYAVSLVGIFAVLGVLEARGITQLHQYSGLGRSSPLLGACLSVFILSLAGIPPFAGFFGKFYVFVAAARHGRDLHNLWLVMLGIATSCISLYYYLQILKQVWVTEPASDPRDVRFELGPWTVIPCLTLALVVTLLGCWPDLLLNRFH